ncbi:hypothetical protein AGMMS50230_22360 [Spirochaetia bacterium]|nr:hypothetical protein AGMMS50230_22360 [Spirochaetia bacterium]
MKGHIHLEYSEKLNSAYTKSYIEIIFDEDNKVFEKIYLYSSRYGIIEIINGQKEIHKWETEDEAQSGSYLKKHYPVILLNGNTEDIEIENNIIKENIHYIDTLNLGNDEIRIINMAIEYLRSI